MLVALKCVKLLYKLVSYDIGFGLETQLPNFKSQTVSDDWGPLDTV